MKKLIVIISILGISIAGSSQFVAKVEIKEPIKGLCSQKDVYTLFPMFEGQKEAVCPVPDEDILKRLDSAVTFLKENPKHKDKGMLSIMINCKGEVVKCEMDTKTSSTVLDEQIVAVFNSLGVWKPGQLNDKKVDSMKLWSFEIKKGVITLE